MSLITPEYREQLLRYRAETRPMWGNGGGPHFRPVQALIEEHGFRTVLDYGCGHGLIVKSLLADRTVAPANVTKYDPGIEEISEVPRGVYDLVICTDVLEHIEYECLPEVLSHLAACTGKMLYVNIHTGPAKAILPDGRNAHLVQQPMAWWQMKLEDHFPVIEAHSSGRPPIRPTFLCRPE